MITQVGVCASLQAATEMLKRTYSSLLFRSKGSANSGVSKGRKYGCVSHDKCAFVVRIVEQVRPSRLRGLCFNSVFVAVV